MSYTSSTPEAADLNNDGVIDFLDLELLAENYRQTGPTTGNSPIPGLLQKIRPTAISSVIPGPYQNRDRADGNEFTYSRSETNRDRSQIVPPG